MEDRPGRKERPRGRGSPSGPARRLLFAALLLLLAAGAPSPAQTQAGDQVAALILQGMYHEAAGQYEAGILLYLRAAEAAGEGAGRAEALALAGIASLKAGDLAQARELLFEASELLPRSALVQYYLGRLYEMEGSLKEARERYLKAAELSPAWPDPVVRAGALMNREGEYAASVSLLHKAMPIAGRLAEYHRELSAAYLGLLSHLRTHPSDLAAWEALEAAGIAGSAPREALLEELMELAEYAEERARRIQEGETGPARETRPRPAH